MIGDLSNAPEPIQIKIFSDDAALLTQLGPRVGDAIGKIPGVVDVENGIENTISGPATNFQVNPDVAARLGFTPTEVAEDATAILDGMPANDPLIANGRPYTIRVRLADEHRSSLEAIENTVFNSASATPRRWARWPTIEQLPPQNEIRRENLQQLVVVTAGWKVRPGHGYGQGQQTVAGLHLPPQVRVEYGGTYEEQQKSFHDLLQVLLLALALVFGVLLAEFRNFAAPIAILTSSVLSISGVVLALLVTRTTFNVASFMGLIMVIGIVAKNGILLLDADEKFRAEGVTAARSHAARGAAPAASHRDDGAWRRSAACCRWPSRSAPARRCCSRWPSRSSAASRFPWCSARGHAGRVFPADAQSQAGIASVGWHAKVPARVWQFIWETVISPLPYESAPPTPGRSSPG